MKKIISSLVLLLIIFTSKGQNVGIGTNTPDSSAKLDITSTNSGFLPPRMTTLQRNSINNPAPGLQIYNTTTDCLEIFGRGKWNAIYCIPIDSTLATDIDGHSYPTVQICNQTWMAKNLDVSRYRNGDTIPQVTDPTEWANLTTGAWCWYNNDSANGTVYGKLYNWYAVNDPRGLAPAGWHVPSDDEWNTLIKCIDQTADTACENCTQSINAGAALKESGNNHWICINSGANNSTFFSAISSGSRQMIPRTTYDGEFIELGISNRIWSKTPVGNGTAYYRMLDCSNNGVRVYADQYTNGYVVRCVKDTPITTLNDGLVAYYPFKGNANDESGNGNNGTVNGATLTTDRFGDGGKAYSFDGVNDEIRISHNPNLNLIGDFTLSSWYYPNSFPINNNSHTIIAKRDDNLSCCSPQVPYDFSVNYIQNGSDYRKPLLAFANGSYHFSQSQAIVSLQEWQYLTLTYSGDTCRIFINGLLSHTDYFPASYRMGNSSDLLIGSINRAYGDEYMNGKLDDIRIYNRALTQEEITYLAEH